MSRDSHASPETYAAALGGALQQVVELISRHEPVPAPLVGVANLEEAEVRRLLESDLLWGGAGSIADQALLAHPAARAELDTLLLRLGDLQLAFGCAHPRTLAWTLVFEACSRSTERPKAAPSDPS